MTVRNEIEISLNSHIIKGDLTIPFQASGLVIFAHGSNSGRSSPRNNYLAEEFHKVKLATLLLNLLTEKETRIEEKMSLLRFDVRFLAERLVGATEWVMENKSLKNLKIGYFAASSGAAASLMAASQLPGKVKAVVSRGGRPDLAEPVLPLVVTPTLLIVGSKDFKVAQLNKKALERLGANKKELFIVKGATHLFDEPGTLEQVAEKSSAWLKQYLKSK